MKIANISTFRSIALHDTANGRYALGVVTISHVAKVKLFELPDSVLYNPYGGGQAPTYPQKFTADFLFRGATAVAVETMYSTVVDQLGYTATLSATDAGDNAVSMQAILEKVSRTDKWTKEQSNTIKFQLTFQPVANTGWL